MYHFRSFNVQRHKTTNAFPRKVEVYIHTNLFPGMLFYTFVAAAAIIMLVNAGSVQVKTPCCTSYNSIVSGMGKRPSSPLIGMVQLASPVTACIPLSTSNYENKIVLIERGNCSFESKILNAQIAGALGVLIYDNTHNDNLIMTGGKDLSTLNITIPSFFIGLDSGIALKEDNIVVEITTNEKDAEIDNNDDDNDVPIVSMINLKLFGVVAGGIFALALVYIVMFYIYHHCTARVHQPRTKKLVTTIKYHKQEGNKGEPSTIVPATDVEAYSRRSLDESNEPTGPFSIEVVHSSDAVATVPTAEPNNNYCSIFNRCKYAKEITHAASKIFDLGGTCTICLENFEENELVFLLPCKHLFHEACVSGWLKTHGNCPNCKHNLVEVKPETEENKELWCSRFGTFMFQRRLSTTLPVICILLCFALVISFCVVGAL